LEIEMNRFTYALESLNERMRELLDGIQKIEGSSPFHREKIADLRNRWTELLLAIVPRAQLADVLARGTAAPKGERA
jgi:hypothetical protein